MEYGDKIRTARKEKGMSQQELADILNVNKGTVSRWEQSKFEPSIVTMQEMSKILGKPIQYFLSDSFVEEMREIKGDTAYIPILGEIACGRPILATENVEEYREVPKRYLPKGEVFILRAKGDSMFPTICEGDEVLVRCQPDVNDNEIGVALLDEDNEATLKRIKHVGDSVMLIGDNPAYQPIIMNEQQPGRILGKVVQLFRDF